MKQYNKLHVINFQEYLAEQLKNPVIKKYYEEYGEQLRIAYKIVLARQQARMSQTQLARRLGTTQSNIARMESGQQNFTTNTLQKIAVAFHRRLNVEFVAE